MAGGMPVKRQIGEWREDTGEWRKILAFNLSILGNP
jgi:hypothetical protein